MSQPIESTNKGNEQCSKGGCYHGRFRSLLLCPLLDMGCLLSAINSLCLLIRFF